MLEAGGKINKTEKLKITRNNKGRQTDFRLELVTLKELGGKWK